MGLTDEQQKQAVSVPRDVLRRVLEALELAHGKTRWSRVGDVVFAAILEVEHALK